jgi:hypothetical protein
MLTLEQQQRGLSGLILHRPVHGSAQCPSDPSHLQSDPWLRSAASSPGLKMIHAIALWWQRFQIEWTCRYTSRLMKRLDCFEPYLESHFRENPNPPSIERISAQFLNSLQDHPDPLLRAVARLELVCIQSRIARARITTIYWDRNPNLVMDALDRFGDLPKPEPGIRYVLRLGATLPNGVTCVRQVLRS